MGEYADYSLEDDDIFEEDYFMNIEPEPARRKMISVVSVLVVSVLLGLVYYIMNY